MTVARHLSAAATNDGYFLEVASITPLLGLVDGGPWLDLTKIEHLTNSQ